jgi:hypothetical protein
MGSAQPPRRPESYSAVAVHYFDSLLLTGERARDRRIALSTGAKKRSIRPTNRKNSPMIKTP